jgi:hypothetical protein
VSNKQHILAPRRSRYSLLDVRMLSRKLSLLFWKNKQILSVLLLANEQQDGQ